ncbi:MAG TPA: ABC transporter substrate-binding protein [Clostridiales bacterium]|nr:ABC transporter substrate-binding protein [Clostridiales bacterium]
MRKKLSAVFAFILAVYLMFPGCSKHSKNTSDTSVDTGFPVNVNGTEITAPPSKVAVLSPSLTEIIWDMGFGPSMAIRSEECVYPEQAAQLDSAGSVLLPDMDVIIKAKPDLVLTQKTPSDSVKEILKKNNIPLVVIPAAQDFSELQSIYQSVAKIFLGEKQGAEKGSSYMLEINNKLDDINEKVLSSLSDTPTIKALYVADSYIHVATGDTVIHRLITSAGAENPAENNKDWMAEESVLSQAEAIFCPPSIKEKVKNLNGLKSSPAVKSQKVFEIEAELIESQGMRMVEAARRIAKALYPGAFEEPAPTTSDTTSTASNPTTTP